MDVNVLSSSLNSEDSHFYNQFSLGLLVNSWGYGYFIFFSYMYILGLGKFVWGLRLFRSVLYGSVYGKKYIYIWWGRWITVWVGAYKTMGRFPYLLTFLCDTLHTMICTVL